VSTVWQDGREARQRKGRFDVDQQILDAESYMQYFVDAEAWGHCGLLDSWLTEGWEGSFPTRGFGMAPVKAEGTRIE
jgi:hypothetical protein